MSKLFKYLRDLGFTEIKPNLWRKVLENGVVLYRDYRNKQPTSYAYIRDHSVNIERIKEVKAIEEIERKLEEGEL